MNRKQFGRYEIIVRLGRGGMAEVYKAYQSTLDRYVAIKLLHPFLADDPEFKERFEREARNVAKLRHPNIVQVYDFEYDDQSESYYMVMELIDGKTLKDHLTEHGEQRLPINDALEIVKGATEALAYAHARGMIHRDVKPANLMLDSDGRVVLTDFGIAKIVTGIQFTASGGMVGTPAFMAPEQGLGEAGDERSDIYSLGVILFQLVTGKLPYDAPTPLATILKHLNEPIPNVKELAPDVPESVEKIIYKAMAKDPEERYQSAQEMLVDINAILGLPAPAPSTTTDTPSIPIPKPSKRSSQETKRNAKNGESATLSTSTAVSRPAQRTAVMGISLIAVLIILMLLGLAATGNLQTFFGGILGGLIPTSTPTKTLIPTQTPLPTLTPTMTLTPTATPTATITLTPSVTNTPSATITPTPSDTLTPTPTLTPSDTPNLTATAIQGTLNGFFGSVTPQPPNATVTPNYTQTYIACSLDLRQTNVVNPKDNPIPIYSAPGKLNEFTGQISVLNTSDCDWLPGTYLYFISGDQLGAPIKIIMNNTTPVKPGDTAIFTFKGAPQKNAAGQYKGGTYTGIWELRLLGDIPVKKNGASVPVTIAFFLYEN